MLGNLTTLTAYLAGPIDRVSEEESSGWRDKISVFLKDIGVIVLNPLDKPIDCAIENTENIQERKKWKELREYNKVTEHMKEIRGIDLGLVDMASFVIVNLNLDHHMCGTYEELFWANRCKKPIMVHVTQGKSQAPDWLFGTIPHEHIFSHWSTLKQYLLDIHSGERKHKRWKFYKLQSQMLDILCKIADKDDQTLAKLENWYFKA